MVEKDHNSSYQPTERAYKLGVLVRGQAPLADIQFPTIDELRARFGYRKILEQTNRIPPQNTKSSQV